VVEVVMLQCGNVRHFVTLLKQITSSAVIVIQMLHCLLPNMQMFSSFGHYWYYTGQ